MVTGLIVFLCLIGAYICLAITVSARGIDALLKTIYEMFKPIGYLIMAGLVILFCSLLTSMLSGGFWSTVLAVVIVGCIVFFLLGVGLTFWEAIEGSLQEVFYRLYDLLTWIGEGTENGLKKMLSIIGNRIKFS